MTRAETLEDIETKAARIWGLICAEDTGAGWGKIGWQQVFQQTKGAEKLCMRMMTIGHWTWSSGEYEYVADR